MRKLGVEKLISLYVIAVGFKRLNYTVLWDVKGLSPSSVLCQKVLYCSSEKHLKLSDRTRVQFTNIVKWSVDLAHAILVSSLCRLKAKYYYQRFSNCIPFFQWWVIGCEVSYWSLHSPFLN